MRFKTIPLLLAFAVLSACPGPLFFRCDPATGSDCDAGVAPVSLAGTWQLRVTAMSLGTTAGIRSYHTVEATERDGGVDFSTPFCKMRVDRSGDELILVPNQKCVVPLNTQLEVESLVGPTSWSGKMYGVTGYCYAVAVHITSGHTLVNPSSLSFTGRGAADSYSGTANCTGTPETLYDLSYELTRPSP